MAATARRPVGYIRVLRENRNFRRLWYGQIVSQLGDWLDSIALFTLLLNLTGSGQAVGLLFLAEFLPRHDAEDQPQCHAREAQRRLPFCRHTIPYAQELTSRSLRSGPTQ